MNLPAPEVLLQPETHLEALLIRQPEFREGLAWGVPRRGHPEGPVLFHVEEVLANIEAMVLSTADRRVLRLVAICHDTFKFREAQLREERQRANHGHLAAEFLQRFPVNDLVRNLVRWHDEAFFAWRMHLMADTAGARNRLAALYDRLRPSWSLFQAFFQADTLTGDKNPEPLRWLAEQRVAHAGLPFPAAHPN